MKLSVKEYPSDAEHIQVFTDMLSADEFHAESQRVRRDKLKRGPSTASTSGLVLATCDAFNIPTPGKTI